MSTTLDTRTARAYRNFRRDGIPACVAYARVKASERGWALVIDAENRADGGREWHFDCGAGVSVRVQQLCDYERCDCWDWAEENPRDDGQVDDIPDHGHFGMVATATAHGREVASDACWGFVWDWPGQDDDAELWWAWQQVAEDVIDRARQAAAAVPAWVVAQVAIWADA